MVVAARVVEMVAPAVEAGIAKLTRWARVEVFLAGFLILAPAALWMFDNEPDPPRGSISAYYDITTASAFYVPLTVVAMLDIVNGLLKQAHIYNSLLGLALLGLILFDHDGATSPVHVLFTALFFGGNIVVVIFFSTIAWPKSKLVILAGIAVAGVLLATGVLSIFFAEWLSMAMISAHYILDQWPTKKYNALTRAERPQVRFWQAAAAPPSMGSS